MATATIGGDAAIVTAATFGPGAAAPDLATLAVLAPFRLLPLRSGRPSPFRPLPRRSGRPPPLPPLLRKLFSLRTSPGLSKNWRGRAPSAGGRRRAPGWRTAPSAQSATVGTMARTPTRPLAAPHGSPPRRSSPPPATPTGSFPQTAKEKLGRVEKLVRQLFASYSSHVQEENVNSTQQTRVNHEVRATANDPWAAWDQQLQNNLRAQVTTELDRYLEENPIPRSKEFDILKWWMGNTSKYPTLARISRDVLAIPASSVASESAFSTGERIISDTRSSLAPETVEALICLQDWYRATTGPTESSLSSIHEEALCNGANTSI